MRNAHFEVPVIVATTETGRVRVIADISQAADLLLYNWSHKRGPEHRAALRACMEVMQGKVEADHGRTAFIAAAKEAGIFAREGIQ